MARTEPCKDGCHRRDGIVCADDACDIELGIVDEDGRSPFEVLHDDCASWRARAQAAEAQLQTAKAALERIAAANESNTNSRSITSFMGWVRAVANTALAALTNTKEA